MCIWYNDVIAVPLESIDKGITFQTGCLTFQQSNVNIYNIKDHWDHMTTWVNIWTINDVCRHPILPSYHRCDIFTIWFEVSYYDLQNEPKHWSRAKHEVVVDVMISGHLVQPVIATNWLSQRIHYSPYIWGHFAQLRSYCSCRNNSKYPLEW